MINCPDCGTVNALGIVFCTGCGHKLPASGLTREDVASIGRIAARRRRIFRVINIVITAWLVICLALALWPESRPFYEFLPEIGPARRLHRKIETLAGAARRGEDLEVEVSAEELNAYLRNAVLGGARGRNGSVRIEPDGVRVRWLLRLFAMDVENVGGFAPRLSLDVRLKRSVLTGRLRVTGVRFGHLPLTWPVRGLFRDLFLEMCRARVEWPLVRQLRIVSIAAGRLTVATSKGGAADGALDSLSEALPLGARGAGGTGGDADGR